MLRQACVSDIRSGRITREDGYIAITMHRYPRGLRKELRDEYIRALAPDQALLDDLHAARQTLEDHNAAFESIQYEKRFNLSTEAIEHLRRLSEMSRDRDVYLICQCDDSQRCHRELLLLLAQKWFDVPVAPTRFQYPDFDQRIPKTAQSLA